MSPSKGLTPYFSPISLLILFPKLVSSKLLHGIDFNKQHKPTLAHDRNVRRFDGITEIRLIKVSLRCLNIVILSTAHQKDANNSALVL